MPRHQRNARTAEPGVASGKSEAAGRTRLVRLRGRIVLQEPSSPSPVSGQPPPPLRPESLGIGMTRVLQSLVVTSVEGGAVVASNEAGQFVLESQMPVTARRMTVYFASNLLVRVDGRDSITVPLEPGLETADVSIDVPMTSALVAQPRFEGRPIRPEDLQNPEILAEFQRQMTDLARAILPPPQPMPAQSPDAPATDAPATDTPHEDTPSNQ
jgi:hypothetical protein